MCPFLDGISLRVRRPGGRKRVQMLGRFRGLLGYGGDSGPDPVADLDPFLGVGLVGYIVAWIVMPKNSSLAASQAY